MPLLIREAVRRGRGVSIRQQAHYSTHRMTPHTHDLTDLFDQLGISSDRHSIAHFIRCHTVLGNGTHLHDGASWSASQSTFLREAIDQDGDWALVVDQLNAALHH